jgi:hypothetical protein
MKSPEIPVKIPALETTGKTGEFQFPAAPIRRWNWKKFTQWKTEPKQAPGANPLSAANDIAAKEVRGRYPFNDLTGKVFSRLTVVAFAGRKHELRAHRALWRVRCSCGTEKLVRADSLLNGSTRSCKCYVRDLRRAQMTALHALTAIDLMVQ